MFRAVLLFSCLSALSAIALFWVSFGLNPVRWGAFAVLGGASIAAALFYTMGRHPYGYNGLGDFFVFVFFGLVAVCGAYALYPEAPLSRLPGLPRLRNGTVCHGRAECEQYTRYGKRSRQREGKRSLCASARWRAPLSSALIGLGLLCWVVYLVGTERFPDSARGCWRSASGSERETVFCTTLPEVLDAQLRRTSISAGLFNLLMAVLLIWQSGVFLAW